MIPIPHPPTQDSTADDQALQRRMSAALSGHAVAPHLLQLFPLESDSAMLLAGSDRRIVFANAGFTRMLGYAEAEVVGQHLIEVLAGRDTDPQLLHDFRNNLPTPGGRHGEVLVYTRAGRPLWVSGVVNPTFDEDGRLLHLVYVFSDITLSKIHEMLQFKVLDAMLQDQPLGETMAQVCTEIERVAPDLVATALDVQCADGRQRWLAGPSLPASHADALVELELAPEFVSHCYEERVIAALADPADPSTSAASATSATSEGTGPRGVCDLFYRKMLASLEMTSCWIRPIEAKNGEVLGAFVFYFRALHHPDAFQQRLVELCMPACVLALEHEKTRAHLHRLAFYDVLTGLPNREMLYSQAERELDEVALTVSTLAVLVIDLDRFKLVNDSQGHAAGDALLFEVGQRLKRGVRGIDLVGRLSGDEFVAILPSCSVEHAAVAAERLLNAIAAPFALEGGVVNPGASIGVAMFPEDGGDMNALLRHADLAMAHAKSDGRNCSRFFNDGMNHVAQERVALESALREALAEGQLTLSYQPQMFCAPGHPMYGVEALARWRHPRFGQVPPDRFIALAEECGLIGALGEWALAESCRQMADWRRRGVAVPRVAVNLSAQNFQDVGLVVRVAAGLRSHGLVADDLTLEMTERAMLDSGDGVQTTIKAVHALGVHLSLDDFGTGYSSLSYLHRLPMKELKLDKSFVQDLDTSPAARSLIQSVLHIGESLGLTVVAEGVETQTQFDFLRDRGCDVAQGYLFARPMSPDDLERWLAER